MKSLVVFIVLTLSPLLFAETDHCSDWVKIDRVTCIFAGEDATPWERVCTDTQRICKNPRFERQPCDSETICVDSKINPNLLQSDCTDVDKKTGRRTRRWDRACQKGRVETIACSDSYPGKN
jgi:hypothetical protein